MVSKEHHDVAAMTRILNELAERPEMAPVAEALAALQNEMVARLEALEAGQSEADLAEVEAFIHTEIDKLRVLAIKGLTALLDAKKKQRGGG